MGRDTDGLRWLQQVADGTTVTGVSEVEPVSLALHFFHAPDLVSVDDKVPSS
jgi:hypothetical protein